MLARELLSIRHNPHCQINGSAQTLILPLDGQLRLCRPDICPSLHQDHAIVLVLVLIPKKGFLEAGAEMLPKSQPDRSIDGRRMSFFATRSEYFEYRLFRGRYAQYGIHDRPEGTLKSMVTPV